MSLGPMRGFGQRGRGIVAIERDVDAADRDVAAFELANPVGDPIGDRNAAAPDRDQHQALGPAMPLDDLARDAAQAPRHAVGVEQHAHSGSLVSTRSAAPSAA